VRVAKAEGAEDPPPPPLCARLSTLEHEVVTAGATVGRLARQVCEYEGELGALGHDGSFGGGGDARGCRVAGEPSGAAEESAERLRAGGALCGDLLDGAYEPFHFGGAAAAMEEGAEAAKDGEEEEAEEEEAEEREDEEREDEEEEGGRSGGNLQSPPTSSGSAPSRPSRAETPPRAHEPAHGPPAGYSERPRELSPYRLPTASEEYGAMYAAGEQAAVSFCNGLKGLLRIRAPALPEPATAGAPPHTPPPGGGAGPPQAES